MVRAAPGGRFIWTLKPLARRIVDYLYVRSTWNGTVGLDTTRVWLACCCENNQHCLWFLVIMFTLLAFTVNMTFSIR
jgi:hypothetical protein